MRSIIPRVAVVAAVLLAVGCGGSAEQEAEADPVAVHAAPNGNAGMAAQPIVAQRPAPPANIDENQRAIREYLRENLDDPEFEEVRW